MSQENVGVVRGLVRGVDRCDMDAFREPQDPDSILRMDANRLVAGGRMLQGKGRSCGKPSSCARRGMVTSLDRFGDFIDVGDRVQPLGSSGVAQATVPSQVESIAVWTVRQG